MRRRVVLIVLALCIAMVVGALPAGAAAQAGYRSSSKSVSADAWWSSWDWESGVEPPADMPMTDWWMGGGSYRGIFKEAGLDPVLDEGLSGMVWMSEYQPAVGADPAVWTEFSAFVMPPLTDPLEFSVGRKLTSASLEFIAPAVTNTWIGTPPYDEGTGEMREPDESIDDYVSVTATWRAGGGLQKSMMVGKDSTDGFSSMYRYRSAYRTAPAEVLVVGADTVYFDGVMSNGTISESMGGDSYRGSYPW